MKRMTKTTILGIVIVMIMTLVSGCGSGGGEADYQDAVFIKSVSKGLEARWKITDIEYADKDITIQGLGDAIQAELDQLDGYESAAFEDTKLQEKAIKYINVLKDCKENVSWAFADDEKYDEWCNLYNERTMLIKDFVDNYGLTVPSKWQDTLDELLADGTNAAADKSSKDAMEALAKSLEFEKVEDDYGWYTYEAVVDNTTDYDIDMFDLEVNLLDEDGVIVETEYASAENIRKGQKAKVTFETDQNFDKYEVILDYYDTK